MPKVKYIFYLHVYLVCKCMHNYIFMILLTIIYLLFHVCLNHCILFLFLFYLYVHMDILCLK